MKINMIFYQIFLGLDLVIFVLFLELPADMTIAIIGLCERMIGSVTVDLEQETVEGRTLYTGRGVRI